MGQGKSKPPPPMKLPPVPKDSPLGFMLAEWKQYPGTRDKDKAKMIHYCVEVWGGKEISGNVFWPVFGSSEDWVRQKLNLWVNTKTPFSQEESDYASIWVETPGVFLFNLKQKPDSREDKKRGKREEEVPLVPPPYVPPQAPPLPDNENAQEQAEAPPRGPMTRQRARQQNLYPLREMPMGGPQAGIGFISVPLSSGDVRDFKKEMGNLLEDPLGVSERVDQFLGPNIYTWDELQSILGILFTSEEKNMIRHAGMRIWDAQHAQGPQADLKWPLQNPNWNHQNPEHRGHMQDLRTIIIQGIREAVPRGQNINKAFNERQKKEETPTEWLERLRKNLQLYSGIDPEAPVGQALLKTQFVAKSWEDIRKKLEKLDNWQERGLDELLREAQKVYVRREEESYKRQVRMMVTAVRESRRQETPRRDSVIDLKDAFWACPLAESSRDYFAFEWEDPETHRRQQLRWTVLPQGFTESPNLFGQALEQILQDYKTRPGVTLVQYVDDLLLAGEREDDVRKESIKLLNFLGLKGLKVSKAKLQFVEEEVKYLGHYLSKGEKRIDPERVKDNGTAYGVLTQDWAGKKKPVGYLSKLLDPVSKGWPTCLQAVVAYALLTEEAHKITFNSELKVLSPHNIRGILQQKADKWITDSRLLKYEGILLDSPKLTLEVTGLQNPAQFLYGEPDEKELAHNCMTTIEEQTKIRPDLEEEELETGEKLFVDGSSRVIEGKRVSGYAIIGGPELEVIESGPLNKTWSAQACELYAVLRALERLKDKEGTIYTDSKYAFGVVHTFGKIWEERGLMNSQGKDLIHQELIKRVLIALRKPKKIAVVHLRGHQTGIDFRSRGNNAADQEAKKAALMIIRQKEKGGPGTESLDEEKAEYRFTKTEEQKLSQMGICKDQDGKWKLSDGREVLPKAIALEILHRIHEKTHWGTQAIVDRFGIKYMCIGIHNLAKQIVAGCTTCLQVNKASFRKQPLGGRPLAQRPFANIQVDFTELPKVGRVKYLLVIIDHLTHYVEAFPTTRATTQAVVKVLLENIIPRYGSPETIDSDSSPHFVSKILNETMESLGIKWEHHTPWHPQSSGRVERMNGEIKKQLTKLMIETKLSWTKCLPLALLNIRTQPRTDISLSPFEMLYGMPYHVEKPLTHPSVRDQDISQYITALMTYREEMWKKGLIVQRPPLDIALHQIKPGDWVLIKTWKDTTLAPRWEGPYLVLLTTETAIRTAEKG
ncbi:hypothetical protein DUI87_30737 [Hirundo rustica rustica]|uniref:ribonuclease H n=1 Tax=Hirundo rustica rustica TaxID=333673 RepID=A0A3M0J1I2_HIRRU|nr:hypothetical protein DUI87_30737 [Hirundo rustica rustica]